MIVEIDPIAFYIPLPFFGWWPIYWYGISWLVAILSINYIARLNAPAEGVINKKLIDDFIFYGVLGAIIGGRIGYMVFYGLDSLIRDPMTVFKIWEGVYRWSEAEVALNDNFSEAALNDLSIESEGMISDIHASKEYRAHLVKVMTKRAVTDAS